MQLRTITAHNVNDALEDALWALKVDGVLTESRNGPVVRARGPVSTTYLRPDQRVIFSPLRDANPFFHLYECVWMMAGRKDAASVARFTKQMEVFADTNGMLHGAYGFRWRTHFGFDQLEEVIQLIHADPTTRRAVLGMWDPTTDLRVAGATGSKDVPCNTTVYFDPTQGRLDMTVCNRSNDVVWGAYGANAVHMSFLQEFVATAVNLPLGVYHQFSNNWHMYLDREDTRRLLRTGNPPWEVLYRSDDRYSYNPSMQPFPVAAAGIGWKDWLDQAEAFVDSPSQDAKFFDDPFFSTVLAPMIAAHTSYKNDDFDGAFRRMLGVQAPDWRVAGTEWLLRRKQKREAAK